MNIIELAIAAQLIDHRDTAKSLPADFVQSLNEFAHLVRAEVLEEAAGVCDAEFWNATKRDGEAAGIAAGNCAAAIRQLKDKP